MTKKLLDDCFLHDKDRLQHHQAIEILRKNLHAVATTEIQALEACAGRILAKQIAAPRNIPFNDNAAVDGYAFRHADHDTNSGVFNISDRIPAGTTKPNPLQPGSAARIFTGAAMPPGADTVVMQEDCTLNADDTVVIPAGLKPGANCRLAGEDVAVDDIVAECGDRLRSQDIAAIASTGQSQLEVFKKLKLGILSNGDEVLRPGTPFETGKVYDSNHYLLDSLAANLPIETFDLGVCPDDRNAVQKHVWDASQNCDVILSTGGASRGEEDHLVKTLDEVGTCQMWQLAIKPGRPMCFGMVNGTPCFVLPGNPVAAYVCFQLYVRPALLVLGGGKWTTPTRYPLRANFSIRSKPDRREFLRGYLESNQDGQPVVQKYERDGSGLISGLRKASGLIEIPETTTEIALGDTVNFIPFSEFS